DRRDAAPSRPARATDGALDRSPGPVSTRRGLTRRTGARGGAALDVSGLIPTGETQARRDRPERPTERWIGRQGRSRRGEVSPVGQGAVAEQRPTRRAGLADGAGCGCSAE